MQFDDIIEWSRDQKNVSLPSERLPTIVTMRFSVVILTAPTLTKIILEIESSEIKIKRKLTKQSEIT